MINKGRFKRGLTPHNKLLNLTPEEKKKRQNENRLLGVYGITNDDWNRMFEEQLGLCAICGSHASSLPTKLCVDHCHITGRVRGLICNSCNIMISRARDNEEILRAALRYLRKNTPQNLPS